MNLTAVLAVMLYFAFSPLQTEVMLTVATDTQRCEQTQKTFYRSVLQILQIQN